MGPYKAPCSAIYLSIIRLWQFRLLAKDPAFADLSGRDDNIVGVGGGAMGTMADLNFCRPNSYPFPRKERRVEPNA